MDAAAIITACVSQGGTDASRATVLSVLNEAYATQVADSRWYRTKDSIGTTVAGTDEYTVPAAIVEAYSVKVGDYPYYRVGDDFIDELRAGRGFVEVGYGGVFSHSMDSSGNDAVRLHPVPTTSGDDIELLAARYPTDLTDSASSTPITPKDTHSSLIDGTMAILLKRVDERDDLAAPRQQEFLAATEKLRRRKNALLRGSLPAQFLVEGVHW